MEEGSRDAVDDKDGEDHPDTAETAPEHEHQQPDHPEMDDIAGRQDRPPIKPVRRHPGNQKEHEMRRELRQPDIAEIQRVPRQLVDMPGDRHGQDMHAETIAGPREKEEQEVPVPENIGGFSRGIGHAGRARSGWITGGRFRFLRPARPLGNLVCQRACDQTPVTLRKS